MSRTGITYQQVAQLAQEILGSGEQPTVERLRARLKTGSNSTINKYLRDWRANQAQQNITSKDNLPDELVNLLKGLWERVMLQAQEKVDDITQRSEESILQHIGLIQTLQNDKMRLEQTENELKDKLDNLTQTNQVLEEALAKVQAELVSAQHKKERLLQQLADKQLYLETLKQQNKQTQTNLEHYQAAVLSERQHERLQIEKREQELNQIIYQVKLENDITRQKNIDLQNLNEQLALKHQDLEKQFTEMVAKLEINEKELTLANNTIVEQTVSQQHWQAQYQILFNQSEKQGQTLINLQIQNAILVEKCEAINDALSKMTEQNKVLAADKWLSEQEKSKLLDQLLQLQVDLKQKLPT